MKAYDGRDKVRHLRPRTVRKTVAELNLLRLQLERLVTEKTSQSIHKVRTFITKIIVEHTCSSYKLRGCTHMLRAYGAVRKINAKYYRKHAADRREVFGFAVLTR